MNVSFKFVISFRNVKKKYYSKFNLFILRKIFQKTFSGRILEVKVEDLFFVNFREGLRKRFL